MDQKEQNQEFKTLKNKEGKIKSTTINIEHELGNITTIKKTANNKDDAKNSDFMYNLACHNLAYTKQPHKTRQTAYP